MDDFENEDIKQCKWSVSNNDLVPEDLFAIADIHRIMLNFEQMAKMLEVQNA